MYSGDVVDCHKAPTAGDTPALTPNGNRAVIILIPVRLGGEKTNPEYFDFAKVGNTVLSWEFLNSFGSITHIITKLFGDSTGLK